MDVAYPVALDPDYAVWDAFANRYWPAAYIADARGADPAPPVRRGRATSEQERVIQGLLGVDGELVSVEPAGFEAQADWANLDSPETYLGAEQAPEPRATRRASLNQWSLEGDWTIGGRAVTLDRGEGRLSFRFHARDVHLVLGPREPGWRCRSRCYSTASRPETRTGSTSTRTAAARLAEQRLHQLIRQPGRIEDRTLELVFPEPGAEAYCFTFG